MVPKGIMEMSRVSTAEEVIERSGVLRPRAAQRSSQGRGDFLAKNIAWWYLFGGWRNVGSLFLIVSPNLLWAQAFVI